MPSLAESVPSRRALLCCAAAALATGARPAPPEPLQATLDRAARTIAILRATLGRILPPTLRHAVGIMIAPDGRQGTAVLLGRGAHGWGEPAFFTAAGFESRTQSVLLIMTDPALDQILHQRGLRLDGDDPLSLANLARTSQASLRVWPAQTLNAIGFLEIPAANQSWYGTPRTAPEIIGYTPPDLRSSRLRRLLGP